VTLTTVSSQTKSVSLQPNSTASTASVSLQDYLAISDGIWLWFTFSSSTNRYYYILYPTAQLPADNTIINTLAANGAGVYEGKSTDTYHEDGYYNLSESSSYTLCAIAVDAQSMPGTLYKRAISTKSSQNQAKAAITITKVANRQASVSVTRNSYCKRYIFAGLNDIDINMPDILWAATLYEVRNNTNFIYSEDISGTMTQTSGAYSANIIFTFAYDSSNNLSGIIDKKYYSTVTNQEITRSQMRSTGEIKAIKHDLKGGISQRHLVKLNQ
jgi:hypothetical protein